MSKEKESAEVIDIRQLMGEKVNVSTDVFGEPLEIVGDKETTEFAEKQQDLNKQEELKKTEEVGEVVIEKNKPEIKLDEEQEPEKKDSEEEGKKPEIVEGELNTESEKFRDSLKKQFGDDFSIIREGQDGEEEEIKVSDLNLDQESYIEILEGVYSQREEELKSNSISKDSMSKFAENLIEIERIGGDVTDLLRVKDEVTNPLSEMNLSTDEGKKDVIRLRFNTLSQFSPEEVEMFIKSYEDAGKLDAYADAAESELKKAIDEHAKSVKDQAIRNKKEREEMNKKYKTEISKALTNLNLNDSTKRKVAKLATEMDDKGRFKMDEAYYNTMGDPEKAAKLALFVLDEALFMKTITNKAVEETKLETVKRYRIPNRSTSTSSKTSGKKDLNTKDDEIGLEDFN